MRWIHRRWLRRVLFALGGGLTAIVLAVLGLNVYLLVSEHFNRSGRVYVVTSAGKQYLEQSQILVTPPPTTPTPTAKPTAGGAAGTQPAHTTLAPLATPSPTSPARPSQRVPLPPVTLSIPDIALSYPVVLADNQHLPRVKVVGWFFKSAFPGTAGNLVLIGHLDGPAQTFARLTELQPGDSIRVTTAADTYTYTVDSSDVVLSSDVGVLAPTSTPIVTLITCAGDWNPKTRTYDQRLVVRGHLTGAEAIAATP